MEAASWDLQKLQQGNQTVQKEESTHEYVSAALPSRFLAIFYQSGRSGHHSMSQPLLLPILSSCENVKYTQQHVKYIMVRHHFTIHM